MEITKETIDEYFERYEWQTVYLDDQTWQTGFRGDVSSFRIIVRQTDDWIFFFILPYILAPTHAVCEWRLHKLLLRANFGMNMAKFYIDDDGDVGLTVELPTENLDYSEFADALNALAHYADQYYLEVLNVAQDPEAPSPFELDEGAK